MSMAALLSYMGSTGRVQPHRHVPSIVSPADDAPNGETGDAAMSSSLTRMNVTGDNRFEDAEAGDPLDDDR